jgi:hypothetical protein
MMEPLYSELHSVVRDMETEYVTDHGGYVATNPYWATINDFMAGVEWPKDCGIDYPRTFARMSMLAVA